MTISETKPEIVQSPESSAAREGGTPPEADHADPENSEPETTGDETVTAEDKTTEGAPEKGTQKNVAAEKGKSPAKSKPRKEAKDKPGKEAKEKAKDEPRRSRLWKKKDMPGGLWLKCESCNETIYRKELEEKQMVCPSCGFHFTVPGRERIAMVLDADTWEERFAELTSLDRLEFTDKIPYSKKIAKTTDRLQQNEALFCGFGKILGRKIVLGVLDFKFLGGSMGEVVGEKIALAAELAMTLHLPLVLFTSSGGARMHEGMLSLMQMAKTCAALYELNRRGGFSMCVMTNPTTGGVTASFATVCDITLAEPGALIGFAGPRVIATTLKQELPPGFQRAEFLMERGQLDVMVKRDDLRKTLASLIDFAEEAWSGRAAERLRG